LAVGSAWAADAEGVDARAVIERLSAEGLEWFAVTSIERDGMLGGPDLETLIEVRDAFPEAHLIASGGISSVEDLRALSEAGMAAAILGRSLYEGRIDLKEAVAATRPPLLSGRHSPPGPSGVAR
jgi:phosphoribosylformimino-5-aminoimidazole carboxamide ribonucleotide (ProFAR) isomerase